VSPLTSGMYAASVESSSVQGWVSVDLSFAEISSGTQASIKGIDQCRATVHFPARSSYSSLE
jgi:hypothetical protein